MTNSVFRKRLLHALVAIIAAVFVLVVILNAFNRDRGETVRASIELLGDDDMQRHLFGIVFEGTAIEAVPTCDCVEVTYLSPGYVEIVADPAKADSDVVPGVVIMLTDADSLYVTLPWGEHEGNVEKVKHVKLQN